MKKTNIKQLPITEEEITIIDMNSKTMTIKLQDGSIYNISKPKTWEREILIGSSYLVKKIPYGKNEEFRRLILLESNHHIIHSLAIPKAMLKLESTQKFLEEYEKMKDLISVYHG